MEKFTQKETTISDFQATTAELMQECFDDVAAIESTVNELLKAKTPSKKALNKLSKDVSNLSDKLKIEIPWLQSRFNEEIFSKFEEVKAEANAWFQSKLSSLGLKNLPKNKLLK